MPEGKNGNCALFEQFKAVTGTSPLQYQKDLRLLKARDALRTSRTKVLEVAICFELIGARGDISRLGRNSVLAFNRQKPEPVTFDDQPLG